MRTTTARSRRRRPSTPATCWSAASFSAPDANGDGVLSKDEVRQARDSFLAQHPLMRIVVQKNQAAVAATPGSPAANAEQMFEQLVDTNHDGNLQASEVRQIVQTGVTAMFAAADTNRDGQLSPTEVNAALIGMANAAATAAFNAADVDHNGQISQAEFDKSIVEPANAIFRAMDANNDGQISPQEAHTARQTILNEVKKLRVPEPANSARNIINSGGASANAAPVPNFPPPTATQPRCEADPAALDGWMDVTTARPVPTGRAFRRPWSDSRWMDTWSGFSPTLAALSE